MKKETLEEVAENFWLNDDSMTDNDRISYVNGFVEGAKWQQEIICIDIEQKWNEYRHITNNEDAWSFKDWLVKELTIK